jgi:hypothetical protein
LEQSLWKGLLINAYLEMNYGVMTRRLVNKIFDNLTG